VDFSKFRNGHFSVSKLLACFLVLAMASNVLCIDAAEKAWRDYELSRLNLDQKPKHQLCFLLSEKKKSMGESGFVKESLTKNDIIDMLLVPVMKPVGCEGLLSHQWASSSSSSDVQGSTSSVPKMLMANDLVHPDGKQFSVKELDGLLSERGLSKVGNKAMKRKRLLEYHPREFRETKKRRQIEIFKECPNHLCILQKLWDFIEDEVRKLQLDENVIAAGELATLRPHILQHVDNSVSFHIHKVSVY